MPKHVSFETPIDWRQWKLDRAIRSMRMWVDGENDLYAVPVVIVDPTGLNASADGQTRGIPWIETQQLSFLPGDVIHNAPNGMESYVQGWRFDPAGCTKAVAGDVIAAVATAGILGNYVDAFHYYCDVNPSLRPSMTQVFGHPLVGQEVLVYSSAALTAYPWVFVWGYDQ